VFVTDTIVTQELGAAPIMLRMSCAFSSSGTAVHIETDTSISNRQDLVGNKKTKKRKGNEA
jgi:hypothetical protein